VTPNQPKLPSIHFPLPIQHSPTSTIQPSPVFTPSATTRPYPNVQQAAHPTLKSPIESAQKGSKGSSTRGKQHIVVGIQSLGAYTVTINHGQLMVQGPDHAAATVIAQQLSSGQAKLATLGGRQVLLTTSPAVTGPAQAPRATSPPTETPSRPGPTLPSSPNMAGNSILANLPQSVVKQGHIVMKESRKVMVLPERPDIEKKIGHHSGTGVITQVTKHFSVHQSSPM